MNSNSDKFLETYKLIEEEIKSKYGNKLKSPAEAIVYAENNLLQQGDRAFLDYCRKLRNFVVHETVATPSGIDVEPNKAIVDYLDEIYHNKILKPLTAQRLSIKFNEVFTASEKDNVLQIIREMKKHCYTHVPIMSEGHIIGVFSENTIMDYVGTEPLVDFSEKIIADMGECLKLDKHITEVFYFLGKDTLYNELKQKFEDEYSSGKRIGMIFVTAHGKQTEKPLGIITAWDVLGNKDVE